MCRKTVKNVLTVLLASAFFACIGTGQVYAKGKEKEKAPELQKEEPGFYYGYGNGTTPSEAEFLAKKELIENVLTEELKATKPRASRIIISNDAVNSRLQTLKFSKNNKLGTDVSCKIKMEKWTEEEDLFRKNLRSSLNASFDVLKSKKSLTDKIESSVYILNQLSLNGLYDLLTFDENGSELYSKKVEAMCGSFVDEISFSVSVPSGFVNSKTKYAVSVKDGKGKAVAGLTVKASWSLAELPVSYDDSSVVDEVVTEAKTDANGVVNVSFPSDAAFRNKAVVLTVSTSFSASKLATSAMRKLDARSSVDTNFIYCEDFAGEYKTVMVPAGEFEAGSIDGDKKAGSKEVKHKVSLDAFEMSAAPVTNAQYAAYIFATGSENYPEYMSNPDFNKALQPVIGVSYEDALAYAAWLSEQTGDTYRLPTADEWEKAARAGKSVIYPWGNDDPSKKKNANYNKNGKFRGPSPVGSFAEGANEWGLVDMSGNVWEWTSTADAESDSLNIVKGGSWMDGPTELRISNFKAEAASEKSNEVGFRLVKEVK